MFLNFLNIYCFNFEADESWPTRHDQKRTSKIINLMNRRYKYSKCDLFCFYSEGDVDSVTSNISDLVNDLSSDISANITSPLDRSKHNNTASNNNTTNNSNTSAHTSPANINSKTISAEGQKKII